MSRSTVTRQSVFAGSKSVPWREYLELCKPRVVMLLVFTAIAGMFLATPGMVPPDILIFGATGIALVASAAAAINHVVDRRADALMARTRHRPLPAGHVGTSQALLFAAVLGTVGVALLAGMVNVLTAVLTVGSLIGYAVVYTLYLKRATPQNIVIGGAAGAVTGQLDPHALLLFLIVFVWTPPHFWALAIHRRDEYALASIPMLPVTHGVDYTRLQVLLYTLLLLAVSVLPFATHMSGALYLVGALVLGAGFVYHAVMLLVSDDARWALRTFLYSIHYLMVLFAVLMADHYVPVLASWAQRW
jgi:protoheme IX farnesyltransferase